MSVGASSSPRTLATTGAASGSLKTMAASADASTTAARISITANDVDGFACGWSSEIAGALPKLSKRQATGCRRLSRLGTNVLAAHVSTSVMAFRFASFARYRPFGRRVLEHDKQLALQRAAIACCTFAQSLGDAIRDLLDGEGYGHGRSEWMHYTSKMDV
jgi:hypothetical protein